jgi:hypothetical protein
MHGLIICAFESFVRNTYGEGHWAGLVERLDAGLEHFEPMFHYDDGLAAQLLADTAVRLDKPAEALLEDFGIFLATHPASERVRRLLRFGGVDYEGFLASLEDLSGRVRLAVPDLLLPDIVLEERGPGDYLLRCDDAPPEFAPVLTGLLQAMADDYGALVVIEQERRLTQGGAGMGDARLAIRLLEADFTEGRGFALAQRTG